MGCESGEIESQSSGGPQREVAERSDRTLDLGDGRPDAVEQNKSGLCRRNAAGGAVQQSCAKPLFEVANGVTESGSGETEPLCGASEAAFLRHREECCQFGKLGPTHDCCAMFNYQC